MNIDGTQNQEIENLILINQNLTLDNQNLKTELNNFRKRCEQYAQAYEHLQRQVKDLLRHRFGKKSERFIDPENRQLDLFNDNFAAANQLGESLKDEDIQVSTHVRKKKRKLDKELPIRIEIIPVADDDKKCTCGACKTVIRYETKELIHYQQAVHEIVEQRREVVACQKGCDGQIITAPAPKHILPKAKATEELLSFLIVSKFDDRQPLYHLERQLSERHGIDISRQTWLVGSSNLWSQCNLSLT
jgi:transposase